MKVPDGCLLLKVLAHFPGLGSDFLNIPFRKQKVIVCVAHNESNLSNYKNIEKVFERKDNSLHATQATNNQQVDEKHKNTAVKICQ